MAEKRLIDANALRKEIDLCDIETFNDIFTICEQIANAPTVDAVEVVHGRWIEKYVYDSDPHDRIRYKCSICGRTEEYKEPYCNCGAKMDGDGNA